MENFQRDYLVEIDKDEMRNINGGSIFGIVIAIGGVASGLVAIGFVAGVAYALVEHVIAD
ncbi:MAG: class IIb bacteriocin, lactobin A/cerein 7B family [Bacteroidales bacterium]|jgi:lactobin A/cerein 7B family class IIb bacteriocin|nr:class IIb bacteriocin, lactobin A/cerein 7B family [Bacteroidales bacterium]MDD4383818.1 class IIb bacteriocin, lactobin A/cerein 7B family [Bacteroidales bacterium]